MHVEGRATDKH